MIHFVFTKNEYTAKINKTDCVGFKLKKINPLLEKSFKNEENSFNLKEKLSYDN